MSDTLKRFLSALVALTLALALAVPASAQDDVQDEQDGGENMFADVTVSAVCSASPKQVTITNDSDFTIQVVSIEVTAEDMGSLAESGAFGGGTETEFDLSPIASGESETYTADDTNGQSFIVVLAALPEDAVGSTEPVDTTVVFVGCIEGEDLDAAGMGQMPGMPATGAGALGGGVPMGGLAALGSLLSAGALASLRRR